MNAARKLALTDFSDKTIKYKTMNDYKPMTRL